MPFVDMLLTSEENLYTSYFIHVCFIKDRNKYQVNIGRLTIFDTSRKDISRRTLSSCDLMTLRNEKTFQKNRLSLTIPQNATFMK